MTTYDNKKFQALESMVEHFMYGESDVDDLVHAMACEQMGLPLSVDVSEDENLEADYYRHKTLILNTCIMRVLNKSYYPSMYKVQELYDPKLEEIVTKWRLED